MSRFTSRKLLITLLTNVLTLALVFGVKLSVEQGAAIIAVANSLYLVINYAEAKASGAPLDEGDEYNRAY